MFKKSSLHFSTLKLRLQEKERDSPSPPFLNLVILEEFLRIVNMKDFAIVLFEKRG